MTANAAGSAPDTADAPPAPRPSLPRRLSAWLHPHRRIQLGLLLAPPVGWLVVAYLGALFILLLNAFWATDSFTGQVIPFSWTLKAFETIASEDVYRTIALRTVGMAALVTVTDIVLAFPIAYYMARVASPRKRGMLVIAVLMPLWAAYLVKVYAWRIVLQGNGILEWLLTPLGLPAPGLDRADQLLDRVQLPVAAVHDPAALRRPRADPALAPRGILGPGRPIASTTFRRVVLPLVFPALVAGSIFTFSLTLGDYITPDLVSDAKFIGNVIYDNSSLGQPAARGGLLAAARSSIMIVYLLVARRLGAFESL